jgi:hypothetical protein
VESGSLARAVDPGELPRVREWDSIYGGARFDWKAAVARLQRLATRRRRWTSEGLEPADYAKRFQKHVRDFFVLHSGSFPADLYSDERVLGRIQSFMNRGGALLLIGGEHVSVDGIAGRNHLFELAARCPRQSMLVTSLLREAVNAVCRLVRDSEMQQSLKAKLSFVLDQVEPGRLRAALGVPRRRRRSSVGPWRRPGSRNGDAAISSRRRKMRRIS